MQRSCGQYVKGETAKEKFKSIERTLKSYSKRLSTKVVGLIPPIPIFEDVDSPKEDGIIIQRMFPLSGVITRTCMRVEYKDKKSVTFTLTSQGLQGGNTIVFETRRPLVIEDDVNLNVNVGDFLTLKVDEPERVGRIFLGILFEVAPGDMTKSEVPLIQFLRLAEMEEQDVILEQETESESSSQTKESG